MVRNPFSSSTKSETELKLSAFCTFLIFAYALYGAYISSLYILVDNKGNLRSALFLLFIIVLGILASSNLVSVFIRRASYPAGGSTLWLLFVYMGLKSILQEGSERTLSMSLILMYILPNFISGVIAFSALKWGIPGLPVISSSKVSAKRTRLLTAYSSLIFAGAMLYFLTVFLDTPLSGVFQIRYLPNRYYQDFGDYLSIAFCCLVALQLNWFEARAKSGFGTLSLILLVQTLLSFLCLQVVTSNKSVLLVTLVFVLTLAVSKPKGWLFSGGRITSRAILVVPSIVLIGVLLARVLGGLDVSQLRVFDYGHSTSLVENTSFQVRWGLLMSQNLDQLSVAPVFGDLSINKYAHSTLISVQTHLGFFGTLLFWSFMFKQLRRVYSWYGNTCLKAISLPILFVAVVSSFFTWGPLWFLMGALYVYEDSAPAAAKGRHAQGVGFPPTLAPLISAKKHAS